MVIVIAFFAWASAFFFLFLALRKHLKSIVGKIGLICLLISAAGLLLACIFTTDPVTTETSTASGSLHNLEGTLGMVMPLAALFICIAIWKNSVWASARRPVLWATIFALIGFVVSAGSLGYMFSQTNGKPGPDVWVGLPTRFEIFTYCVWLITMAKQTAKNHAHLKTIIMAKKNFKTVEEYFESQPKDTKKNLLALRSIIKEAVPDVIELINYDMPAYALVEGGKRDKQIMIAGYKDFVGFYTGTSILENFSAELKKYKVGKASVQFPNNQPIPEVLIIKIVRFKKTIITKLERKQNDKHQFIFNIQWQLPGSDAILSKMPGR